MDEYNFELYFEIKW